MTSQRKGPADLWHCETKVREEGAHYALFCMLSFMNSKQKRLPLEQIQKRVWKFRTIEISADCKVLKFISTT